MTDAQILVETLRLLAEARLKGARPARIEYLEGEVQRLARKVIAAEPPKPIRETDMKLYGNRWRGSGAVGIAQGRALSRVRRGGS